MCSENTNANSPPANTLEGDLSKHNFIKRLKVKYSADSLNCCNLVNFTGCPKYSKSTSMTELSTLSEKSSPEIISHNLNPNAPIFYPRENSTLNLNSCSFISSTEYTRKTQFEEVLFCEQFPLENENSKSRNTHKNRDLCVFANTLGELQEIKLVHNTN